MGWGRFKTCTLYFVLPIHQPVAFVPPTKRCDKNRASCIVRKSEGTQLHRDRMLRVIQQPNGGARLSKLLTKGYLEWK
jgi:hypothetical protein